MSFTFLPKTRLGKFSVGAFATFVVTWTFDDSRDYCCFCGISDRNDCTIQKKRPFDAAHYRHFIMFFD